MTHTLTLTHDEEDKLHRAARKRGQEADALVREAVLQMLNHDEDATEDDLPAPGESLYDALKDHVGGFHSGGDGTLSQNTGEAFTEYLLQKKRADRL